MASVAALAKRTQEAMEAINSASASIAKKLGFDVDILGKVKNNDPEFQRVVQLETIAETLQRIDGAVEKPKDKKK